MKKVTENIILENATIRFRNFSGKEGKYNPAGKRNFCLFLDPDLGSKLRDDGWNIKQLAPRDDGDLPQDYIQVEVSYRNIPPKIFLINSAGKQLLNEDTIDILDWAEIENVDIIVRPYNWSANGNHGVKGYVKSMYVTIAEDEFEKKYADIGPGLDDEDSEEPMPFL